MNNITFKNTISGIGIFIVFYLVTIAFIKTHETEEANRLERSAQNSAIHSPSINSKINKGI